MAEDCESITRMDQAPRPEIEELKSRFPGLLGQRCIKPDVEGCEE
jgi:hypothetical protein